MTILITSTIPVPEDKEDYVKATIAQLQDSLNNTPAPPGTVTTVEIIED